MRIAAALVLSLAFVAAGCSSDATDATAADSQDVAAPEAGSDSSTGDGTAESGANDDDAAEIVGNPDLDLDELAEVAPDAADALEDIAGMVSIGECASEVVGLGMTYVPEGWQCRVLDQAAGGLDGFTLFKPENPGGIEITVGTPSPIGSPCEALQLCDDAEPIDLGDNFDMVLLDVGIPVIYGTHKTVEAEAAVVMTTRLTDDDRDFITMVLNGVQGL